MKKVGRKRALSPERTQELRAKAALYQRIKRECGPAALCRDYGISLTSLRTYTHGLHKRDIDAPELTIELSATEVDALLSRTLHVGERTETAQDAAEQVETDTETAAPEAAVA